MKPNGLQEFFECFPFSCERGDLASFDLGGPFIIVIGHLRWFLSSAVVGSGFLCSRSTSKNHSVGVLSLGVI